MYSENGTTYNEEHSISFGDIVTRTSDGVPYEDFETLANTWEDWHLIPSSRPSIAHPNVVTKFVEIPGIDGAIDLTNYLTGKPVYGQRQGSINFIVVNYFETWETIRENIVMMLHGKRLKMRLMDDPEYYYEGRFTVGQWESGSNNSAVSIGYQLDPYKKRIRANGSTPQLWDTFNFEKDYDYYTVMSTLSVDGENSYNIIAGDYSFAPVVTWISGEVSVTFGGVTKTLNSAGSETLGRSSFGNNTLSVSGNGSVKVSWREEAL
jgi:hypothetical protein